MRDDHNLQHSVWADIDEVGNVLSGIETPPDASLADELEVIKRIVRWAAASKNRMDPYLTPQKSLDQIKAQVAKVSQAISSYAQLNDPAQLKAAVQHAEGILQVGGGMLLAPQGSEDLQEASRSYREMSSNLLESLRSDIADTRGGLTDVRQEIASASSSLAEEVGRVRAANDALVTEIQEQKTRLDTAIQNQVDSFGAAQDERKSNFQASLAKMEGTFVQRMDKASTEGEKVISDLQQAADKLLTNLEDTGKKSLSSIEDLEASSARLANLISRATTAGGFEEYADAQEKAAMKWSITAVLSLAVVAAVGIVVIVETRGDFDLARSVFKLLVASPLLGVFGYAASQSHNHRQLARYNKQLELEVTALGPYLARLDDDDQKSIIEYMALRIFGHLTPPDQDRTEDTTPEGLTKVLGVLRRKKTEE